MRERQRCGRVADVTQDLAYAVLHSSVSTLVVSNDEQVPRIVHWGARLPDGVDVSAFDDLTHLAIPNGSLDVWPPASLLPERARGWSAYGGVNAHRAGGVDWAPIFTRTSSGVDGGTYTWSGADALAAVSVSLRLHLDDVGVLTVHASLTNDGTTSLFVECLAPVIPLPARAAEALTLTGRWAKEMQPQRHALGAGALVVENRRGRTSHQSSPTLFVGTPAFGEETGDVWATHLGWSGNHHLRVEPLEDGSRYVSLAELLAPSEVRLEPGQTYHAPFVATAYSSQGLSGISDAFHAHVRARSTHPQSPRKVILNTWEAVYMRHDVAELQHLADVAASVGVERFVLDDGWFRGRDDDHSSLGDWYVDEGKYPNGLGELVDHVTGLGLEFGLWVEPEMVNPDSDLYRAHPDWALGIEGHDLILARQQLVLDLARPEVSAYLLERLDSLLTEFAIGYLKWDMNRDLVAAGGAHGGPSLQAQTLAVYALLDELRRRHPGVEIESCASGGAARRGGRTARRSARACSGRPSPRLPRRGRGSCPT